MDYFNFYACKFAIGDHCLKISTIDKPKCCAIMWGMEKELLKHEDYRYETYIHDFCIEMPGEYFEGIKDELNIHICDSLDTEEFATSAYVPVCGKVKGTNYFCWGIRALGDNMSFNIYCPDSDKIYVCDMVDDIVCICNVIKDGQVIDFDNRPFFYARVKSKNFYKGNTDCYDLLVDMINKRLTSELNETENRCLYYYMQKGKFFHAMLEQLTAVLFDIYPQLIAGFVHKYGLENLDKFCDNATINATYQKNRDFYELYEMLGGLKQHELMEIYEKIKPEINNYSPFAEHLDTSLDLLYYDPEDMIYD